MKENNRNRRHAEGMLWECEVLHFSRNDERAYIVTDEGTTRIYTSGDVVFADSLKAAIARLEANGYRINMQMEIRRPEKAQRPDNYMSAITFQSGTILKTEVTSMAIDDTEG